MDLYPHHATSSLYRKITPRFFCTDHRLIILNVRGTVDGQYRSCDLLSLQGCHTWIYSTDHVTYFLYRMAQSILACRYTGQSLGHTRGHVHTYTSPSSPHPTSTHCMSVHRGRRFYLHKKQLCQLYQEIGRWFCF